MAKLTKATVATLKPIAGQAERIVWDSEVRSFGVRIRASGARTWVIRPPRSGGASPTDFDLDMLCNDAEALGFGKPRQRVALNIEPRAQLALPGGGTPEIDHKIFTANHVYKTIKER